jgi:tRNA threonylcarbamoyladenosine biosynthesis protein TsaB
LNILALETSTPWCSVALLRDEQIWVREELAGQRHSELLLPMVDGLLRDANTALNDVQAVAFGAGPGSFTGLRIACGVAQGLAAGLNVGTIGVSSLMALAQASGATRVIACLDARMGEIYFAAYEWDGAHWQTVYLPLLCAPEAAPAIAGNGWTAVGNGFEVHRHALERRYDGQLAAICRELHPQAREVAVLGARMADAGLIVPPEEAHPVYVRDRVALTVEERQARRAAGAPVRP